MFNKKTEENPGLNIQMNFLLNEMKEHDPDSPEYKLFIEHCERLNAMKPPKANRNIDANTVITVAGNLAGILMIVGFEHAHVLTSKALGFIGKP